MTAVKGNGSAWRTAKAYGYKASGKWYFEVSFDAGSFLAVGVASVAADVASYIGVNSNSIGYVYSGAINAGSTIKTIPEFGSGSKVKVAMDLQNGLIWFSSDANSWNGNSVSDPVRAIGGVDISTLPIGVAPAISQFHDGDTVTANFGRHRFWSEPPRGFERWKI